MSDDTPDNPNTDETPVSIAEAARSIPNDSVTPSAILTAIDNGELDTTEHPETGAAQVLVSEVKKLFGIIEHALEGPAEVVAHAGSDPDDGDTPEGAEQAPPLPDDTGDPQEPGPDAPTVS